jgi:peroxiredoxin
VQLGQLQKTESSLTQLGYQILALSADRPEKLQASVEKHAVTYVLLSDAAMAAARAFGVAYQVDDASVGKLAGYGIDIEEASGQTHHMLPVPSVFLVAQNGRIVFTYANPDHRVRIDPDVLLAAARAAAKE